MKRLSIISMGLLVTALTVFGCATTSDSGWVTLIDGRKGLENFTRIGDANWRAEGGAIVADKGTGTSNFLLTKNSYRDFELRTEFWADTNTNSGIFIRIPDTRKINGNPYEVNIYDLRPGQEYSTGSIMNVGRVPVPNPYKAGGKWNTLVIKAKGTHLSVELNGVQTATANDSKSAEGPFALQFGNHGKMPGGAIKWRKVQIRPL